MIKYIYVKKLFGRFDYKIDFKKGGITIITGPNGFGKSTLLKIIDSIANGRIDYFLQIDFKKITLGINNKEIKINKENDRLKINDIEIKITTKNIEFDLESFVDESFFMEYVDDYTVYNKRLGRNIPYDEIFLHYIRKNENKIFLLNETTDKIDDKLKAIRNYEKIMGDVRLISAQRLYKRKHNWTDKDKLLDVIEELPIDLQNKIKQVSSEYASVANKLDGTYTKRLLTEKTGIKDEEEYQKLWSIANKNFLKLKEYKLIDFEIIDTEEYNKIYSTALKIYFSDFSEKYAVFEPLIKKLDLFTKIINDRFLFKKIIISKETGFKIIDENTKKNIKLKRLSSGEQQEIVLFYDLIFNVKPDLLLLIDEPEISLHVLWQKMFLDDLIKISSFESVNVVVATHSPQIISGHSDIQIDLGDFYEC